MRTYDAHHRLHGSVSGVGLVCGGGRRTIGAMRRTIPLLAMLLLAACSNYGGGGSGYGGTGTPAGITDAHFLKDDPTVIEVKVRDPLPVTRVVLIDPTGAETPAHDIQRDTQTYRSDGYGASPSVGVGVFGGSSGRVGTGIGIGVPIFSSGQSGYDRTVVDSTAKVRINNPVLYRTTWQDWKLRAELGAGSTKRTIELAPPKPL
jgi:hypothetical protein